MKVKIEKREERIGSNGWIMQVHGEPNIFATEWDYDVPDYVYIILVVFIT